MPLPPFEWGNWNPTACSVGWGRSISPTYLVTPRGGGDRSLLAFPGGVVGCCKRWWSPWCLTEADAVRRSSCLCPREQVSLRAFLSVPIGSPGLLHTGTMGSKGSLGRHSGIPQASTPLAYGYLFYTSWSSPFVESLPCSRC